MESKEQNGTTLAKQEVFLKEFETNGYHISNAAKKAEITRQTFNNWLNSDEVFAERYNDIVEHSKDEDEAYMRVLYRGIFIKDENGKIKKCIVKPNVRAGMFLLEAKAPERGFRKNYTVNITNEEDIEAKSLEDIKLEMERLAANIKIDSND